MFIRFFSGLLALLLAGHAWAQTCTVYIATAGGFTGSPAASAQAAVDSAVAKFKSAVSKSAAGSGQGLQCGSRGFYSAGTEYDSQYGWVMIETQERLTNYSTNMPYCGPNWSGGGRSGVGMQKKENAECPDTCADKAGTSSIVNVTSGWKRTPAVVDTSEEWVVTYKLPPSGTATICGANSCAQTFDASEPCADCKAYVSQTPGANGLYRVSTDFRAHYSGKSCTSGSSSDLPAEATQANDAKDPPCPGYVGEVNGVRGCFGTATNPVRPVPAPSKPSGVSGTDTGNPAAGDKPGSGEGSGSGGTGRTPSTGSGGSAGGPAGAAAGSGTKPDGTTPKPTEGKEQAACGAPGQPKCGIDETGTPTKYDGNGAALDGWKEGVDKNRATIEKSGSGVFDSFNVFFSAPPIVGCEPIELPNKEVITRHCDVVGGTRAVMAYIWALSALWLCVGWIREAI